MDKLCLVFCPPCASQYGPIKLIFFQTLIIDLKVLVIIRAILTYDQVRIAKKSH